MGKTKEKLKFKGIFFLSLIFIFAGLFIGQGTYLFIIYLFNFKPHAYILYIFILLTWYLLFHYRSYLIPYVIKMKKSKRKKIHENKK